MRITIFVHTTSLEKLNDFLNGKEINSPIQWMQYRESIKDYSDSKYMYIEVSLTYEQFTKLKDNYEYKL